MKLFLSSLGVFLFVLASWLIADVFLFQRERDTKRDWLKQISERECILNELLQVEKRGDYQKKYGAILNAEWGALENKIPPTAEASRVLALLHKVAAESKVVLHDFQVGKAEFKETWFELPIAITLTASFPGLMNFLKGVAEQERFIMVQGLKYGPGKIEVKLLVYFGNWRRESVVLKVNEYRCGDYTIPEKLDLVLAIPKVQGPLQKLGRNPFIVPEVLFHLTGVILEGDEWVALLEDEKGVSRVVREGDEVMDGFEVKKILKDSIFLSDGDETKQLTWSN